MPEQKKKNSIVAVVVILVIFAIFVTLGIMFGGKGENKSDLAACGDFPRIEAGGGPTSYFDVCRNADTGDCYYKKIYFKQISGCDPQFSDENPYGREECFKHVSDIYNAKGSKTEREQEGYRQTDNCASTSQQYFDSKVKSDTSDLSVCGNFPVVPEGGQPGASHYSVCRDQFTGDCYYKYDYSEQIKGCNPEFSDANPYGKAECFKPVADIYDAFGKSLEKFQVGYHPNDNCKFTSQEYFDTKVKK